MPESAAETGGRAETRSNIFVAATIASAEVSGPIRIRNMSPLGALIEGGAVPPEGARVQVNRGSLSVTGTVAWQNRNRAGIRFDSTVNIADWLPSGSRTRQQRIDEAVHAYKASGETRASAAPNMARRSGDLRSALTNLQHVLRRVAEELAQDAIVCERHLTNVQLIDVAAQKLARLTGEIR